MKKDNNIDHYIPEGHTDITVWPVGTIVFPESLLEAEVAANKRINIKSIGELKIEVYSNDNEGQVPHFHLFTPNHDFESCICIYSANYFGHGGKYRDKLSNKQCRILDEYLRQPHKLMPTASVWNVIKGFWETGNTNCKFPEKRKVLIQPDYSSMVDYKDS